MGKIKIGDRLPAFKLQNQDGKWLKIHDFIGKSMVIYFYPKDDTPGCTKEACAFRDEFHRFSDAGVFVFGISSDSVATHKKFKAKYQLPFDLLADVDNKVRNMFGVPSDLFGLIPGRVTYVVDSKGIIQYIFNNQLNAKKHVEESLRMLNKIG
jgi:peroxiredoxin Q/BCP